MTVAVAFGVAFGVGVAFAVGSVMFAVGSIVIGAGAVTISTGVSVAIGAVVARVVSDGVEVMTVTLLGVPVVHPATNRPPTSTAIRASSRADFAINRVLFAQEGLNLSKCGDRSREENRGFSKRARRAGPTQAGPAPRRSASIAAAARLPAPIATITVAAPVAMSPPA